MKRVFLSGHYTLWAPLRQENFAWRCSATSNFGLKPGSVKQGFCYCIGLLFMIFNTPCFSWNAMGHYVVTTIALNHLSPEVKQRFSMYNHAVDNDHPKNMVSASAWLDSLRSNQVSILRGMHFINKPFSEDGTALPEIDTVNVVWAIRMANKFLADPNTTTQEKGIALRILMHTLADVHQPLHASTKVSAQYPKGDLGGNLVILNKNLIAKNLHAYWDKGGGLLSGSSRDNNHLQAIVHSLEAKWPCDVEHEDLEVDHWVNESYDLAVSSVYPMLKNNHPDVTYQALVQQISERRLAQAGCRLAGLLNRLYQQYPSNKQLLSVV